jgi:hypothetical protein
MFEHVLILVTPSGGFIDGKAKERVCPARRTNLVVVFGRGSVKLEGDLRGTGAGFFRDLFRDCVAVSLRRSEVTEAISYVCGNMEIAASARGLLAMTEMEGNQSPSPRPSPLKGEGDQGNGLFLGTVKPLASCLHDVARVDDGHVEGGEIDVPIFVMGGGDEDEIVVS